MVQKNKILCIENIIVQENMKYHAAKKLNIVQKNTKYRAEQKLNIMQ